MAKFFDLFPTIPYDITGQAQNSNYETATNIFFRLRIIREVVSNISSYYEYIIRDEDTPENLAFNFYDDAEAHWIILMANDIVDGQYDWPLSEKNLRKHIADKYRSATGNANSTDAQVLAWTQSNIHHYEKVIERTESLSGTITKTAFQINYTSLTDGILTISPANGTFTVGETVYISNDTIATANFTANVTSWSPSNGRLTISNSVKNPHLSILYETIKGNTSQANGVVASIDYPTVPFDYYTALPSTQSYQVVQTANDRSVLVNIYRNEVSYYDYEYELNDAKRTIKIIKPEYYPKIKEEFNRFTKYAKFPYIRKLV